MSTILANEIKEMIDNGYRIFFSKQCIFDDMEITIEKNNRYARQIIPYDEFEHCKLSFDDLLITVIKNLKERIASHE